MKLKLCAIALIITSLGTDLAGRFRGGGRGGRARSSMGARRGGVGRGRVGHRGRVAPRRRGMSTVGRTKPGRRRPAVAPGGRRHHGRARHGVHRRRPLNLSRPVRRDRYRNRTTLHSQRNFLNRHFGRGRYNWNRLYSSNWPLFISLFPFAYYDAYGAYPPVYYDYYDTYGFYPEQNSQFSEYIGGELPLDENDPCIACTDSCLNDCLSRGISHDTCQKDCDRACQAQCAG